MSRKNLLRAGVRALMKSILLTVVFALGSAVGLYLYPQFIAEADSHAEVHEHDHGDTHELLGYRGPGSKGIGWTGMFLGLALHTLIDGVALASSVLADTQHGAWLGLAGLGTFLAVALHKPLDAFAITSVMNKQGWSVTAQNMVNLLFSLACPLGALGIFLGATAFADDSVVLGWGLAVSAGFFICIALADLLPEVSFHDHDRGKLTAALLLGVALAFVIENLPGHQHHSHPHGDHTVIKHAEGGGSIPQQPQAVENN